jgi:hypothetical protein
MRGIGDKLGIALAGTRLQGEWSGVERFSVEPGKIRGTTLQEACDGLDQDAKGLLAQLTIRLTQRYTTLHVAVEELPPGSG